MLPPAPVELVGAPIMDVMAAVKAAVKFGSVVIAAVTLSTTACCRGPCCNVCGPTMLGSFCGRPYMGKGIWSGDTVGWARCSSCWIGFADFVRSRVMVGNEVEAERVAMGES